MLKLGGRKGMVGPDEPVTLPGEENFDPGRKITAGELPRHAFDAVLRME